jgi:hypothetical protein
MYSKRWKALELNIPVEKAIPFCTIEPEDIPLLESVTIRSTINSIQTSFPTLSFLRKAPAVCDLSTWNFATSTLGMPVVPYDQITTLSIQYPRCDLLPNLYTIFLKCSNLKEFKLVYSSVADDDPSMLHTLAPVELNSLEKINWHLLTSHQAELDYTLGLITTPSLESVIVKTRNHSIEVLPALNDLLTRSSCSLKELFLLNDVNSLPDLLHFLERCPELETLSVTCGHNCSTPDGPDVELGDWILRKMTPGALEIESATDRIVCPQLRRLELYQAYGKYSSAIREFVDCRLHPPVDVALATIERITIRPLAYTYNREESKDYEADVARWNKSGIKVDIFIPDGLSAAPSRFHPWNGAGDISDTED